MKPTKVFLKQAVLLSAIFIFLFPALSYAQVKEIISEGTYNMGDGETPSVAEERALVQAKRVAVEQAGTYVERRPTKEGGKGYTLTGHHEIMVPLLAAAIKAGLGQQ